MTYWPSMETVLSGIFVMQRNLSFSGAAEAAGSSSSRKHMTISLPSPFRPGNCCFLDLTTGVLLPGKDCLPFLDEADSLRHGTQKCPLGANARAVLRARQEAREGLYEAFPQQD